MPSAQQNLSTLSGAYSILLLPQNVSSPHTFSQFDEILSQSRRTMLYGAVLGNPDGSLTPMGEFQSVVPLSSSRASDITLEQLRISSPPRQPPSASVAPTYSISTARTTRAQSVPAVTSSPPLRVTSASSRLPHSRSRTPQPPTILPGSENLDPRYEQRPIRGIAGSADVGGYTAWYHTEAPYSLNAPRPTPKTPELGTVYIHTDTSTMTRQIWVSMQGSQWRSVQKNVATVHPRFPDRYLWIHENGLPTWVVKSTYKNYVAKQA